MTKKPSYEELEKRLKDLEKEVVTYKEAKQTLQKPIQKLGIKYDQLFPTDSRSSASLNKDCNPSLTIVGSSAIKILDFLLTVNLYCMNKQKKIENYIIYPIYQSHQP